MFTIKADSFNEIYHRLATTAVEQGIKVTTRGHDCFELRPAVVTINDPTKCLYQGESRKLSYRFFAVEALQYMAGWGYRPYHAQLLLEANSGMKSFHNKESGLFDGAYGPRLAPSMQPIVSKLAADPWSRQCFASIWEPELHSKFSGSLDTPCTLGLHFYQGKQGKYIGGRPRLCCTASMRSNDLNWGTPYDIAAFCALQSAVAGCLSWDVGEFHLSAGSLHVYQKTPPKVEPYRDETWHHDVTMPHFAGHVPPRLRGTTLPWITLAGEACDLLEHLADHVLGRQQPFHTFEYDYAEMTDLPRAAYWAHWCALIRWRWSDRGVEVK